MSKRLGKIEKVILLDLLATERPDYRSQKDRSQILYSVYCILNGRYESNFKQNVKKALDLREYRSLQVSITRSTKALEKAGYILRLDKAIRKNPHHPPMLQRKLSFQLTDSGRARAKQLVVTEQLDSAKLNRRTIGGLLLNARPRP